MNTCLNTNDFYFTFSKIGIFQTAVLWFLSLSLCFKSLGLCLGLSEFSSWSGFWAFKSWSLSWSWAIWVVSRRLYRLRLRTLLFCPLYDSYSDCGSVDADFLLKHLSCQADNRCCRKFVPLESYYHSFYMPTVYIPTIYLHFWFSFQFLRCNPSLLEFLSIKCM